MDGFGYHEVIILRDHDKPVAEYTTEETKLLVEMYQNRYLDLIYKDNIKYVSIFHNHGEEAGASIAHPHSQILAIPVMDPDLRGSVDGAEAFYRSRGECVYCTMIKWDIEDGRRIVYENERFVVLCPFAPQVSFEVRVYPKQHQPNFESISESDSALFADALSQALYRIHKGLDDPAYNFYFHTAPRDGDSYSHYHWHLNILPKTSIWAGFELGAGIEISTVEPEKAAEFLRKQK
jgi:UDPglucose--hexose-1-phosphate uridylyltransferase